LTKRFRKKNEKAFLRKFNKTRCGSGVRSPVPHFRGG
jgi:hypothetical protein